MSKHVAPFKTYILSCVDGCYVVINLKYTGMSTLTKYRTNQCICVFMYWCWFYIGWALFNLHVNKRTWIDVLL